MAYSGSTFQIARRILRSSHMYAFVHVHTILTTIQIAR